MKVEVMMTARDTVDAKDMRPGQCGLYDDVVVLRAHDRLVSLRDPCETWLVGLGRVRVSVFPPGTQIVLTVGE